MRHVIPVNTGWGEGSIRPLDPFRDLGSVVELIELAFGDRLDPVAKATLTRMRRFAEGGLLLQWVWALRGKMAVAPGLVWIEGGRVVGNVSLRHARGRGGYLIGNVVVHPDWRGRGIATALMKAAIRGISRRRGRWIGLEVRADNDVARRIYEGLRFREVGSTLHLLRPAGLSWRRGPFPGSMRRARARDGDALVGLVNALIPEEQRLLLEVQASEYRPGWTRSLRRWLQGEREGWWVVEAKGRIRGAVRAVRMRGTFPNQLEVLTRPGERDLEPALVSRGVASLRGSSQKAIAVSLPAATDPLVGALVDAGFQELHVLVQMMRNISRR